MPDQSRGMLALEDGSTFIGESMGADREWVGQVVFNTSMTGHQEIITDPSYWGQMVVFTCPHIGNVGVNREDVESARPYVRAVLARKISARPSNWRAEQPLHEYLRAHGVPALSGLDTRRLTLLIREKGLMRGALSTVDLDGERLVEMARMAPDMSTLSPVQEVSRTDKGSWTAQVRQHWIAHLEPPIGGECGIAIGGRSPRVVVIDCGIKHNVLRHPASLGALITVMPADAASEEIMAERPDGVLVSNGPGDPEQVPETIATVRELMDQVPLFGICLGHQIIALAAGARICKLPFGHHGVNHPVRELSTGRIEITAQNHNLVVEPDSLQGLALDVTHTNLYDGTIEGIRHTRLPVWGVQYQPEASPGPHDSLHILREFVESLSTQTPRRLDAKTN